MNTGIIFSYFTNKYEYLLYWCDHTCVRIMDAGNLKFYIFLSMYAFYEY